MVRTCLLAPLAAQDNERLDLSLSAQRQESAL